jgi:predicted PurR-regulated permease PerM
MSSWIEDRSRTLWWVLGLILGSVLTFVLWSFVGTFVFGVFIYYATRPVHTRLKHRIRPESLAAALSLFLVALPALLLLAYTVVVGIGEFNRFTTNNPEYNIGQLDAYIQPYLNASQVTLSPDEIADQGGVDALMTALNSAGQYLGLVGLGLLHLFVMIAIAFYLLRDDHRLSRWVLRRFSDDAGVLETYLDEIDRSYNQIFFGNILNAVITGVIGALSYSVLDLFAPNGLLVPYPALLGLLAGLASLVPIVGMKLVYVPAALYLFVTTTAAGGGRLLWFPTAFVLLSFVIVDTIPDLVLRPYVSGRNLHVGMVMFAYILGPLLFGWYGLFLGPMILVLVVHFARVVLPELTAGTPIRPMAVDPGNLPEIESTPEDGDGSTPPIDGDTGATE